MMAERHAIERCINEAEQAMEYAKQQLELGMRQEHYNKMNYSDAQLQLEKAYTEMETMEHYATAEQRDQLYRARLAVQQLQHQMIVTPH